MAWANLTEIAGINISYLSGISSPPTDNVQADVLVLGQNSSAWQRSDGYGTKTWNIDNKLQINTSITSSQRTTYCASIETSHVFMNATGGGGSSIKRADTCFWIDEDNHRAYCVGACATDYGNTWIMYPNISVAYQEELYQIIKGLIPPQYTWQSVPAISGKNGILTLSTLVDINDGEPVETTDATKFTLTSASNVKTLVDAVPLGSFPASGGGASGSNPQYGGQTITGKSGTQVSGYAFGQGGAFGGGGGFYGGYGAEDDVSPAGAGSGYIGNPLLSNKKMYGYGVSKVTTEDAYTVSKTDHSSAAIEKRPKAGNGHARITYLRPSEHPAPVWDGYFFNADFSTDGRDSVRYDSSRTVVCPIDNSEIEPHTAIQGTMFEGFDDTGWSISDGVLDAEYSYNFVWLYDYEHIDNKILPRSCTFYIDIDFWIYDDNYRDICLSFHSPYTYYDEHGHLNLTEYTTFSLLVEDYSRPSIIITQTSNPANNGVYEVYPIGSSPLPITYQTWHNLKAKVELLDSRVSKITLYFNNVEFASKEFDAATEYVPFVCVNDNDTRPAWFCMLSGEGFKTRKVFVGRSVT